MTQVKLLKKVGKHEAGSLQTLPDREAGKLIADKSAVLVQQFWTNKPEPTVEESNALGRAILTKIPELIRPGEPTPAEPEEKSAKRK